MQLREQFPGKAHREVFKMAAEQWKKAPENPDNFYARLPDPPKTASSSSRPSGSSSRPKRRTATGSNSRTSGAAGSSSTGASSSRK